MIEFFSVFFYFLLGFTFLGLFVSKLPKPALCLFSLPIGVLLFVFMVALILLVHSIITIPFPPYVIILALYLGFLLYGFTRQSYTVLRLSEWDRSNLLILVSVIFLLLLMTWLFGRVYHFSVFSGDSVVMLRMSKALFDFIHGSSDITPIRYLPSYPIFVPAMHSMAFFTSGKMNLGAIQPVLSLMLLISASYQLCLILKENVATSLACLVSILSATFLLSSFLFLYQLFYVNGNLITGLFIGNAFLSVILYENSDNKDWFLLSIFCLMAYCFLRIESPLFCSLFILMLFHNDFFANDKRLVLNYCLLVLGLLYSIWYGVILYSLLSQSIHQGIVGFSTLLAQIGILWITIIFTCVRRKRYISFLSDQACKLLLISLSLLVFCFFLYGSDLLLTDLGVIGHNMFRSEGYWGTLWIGIVILYLLSFMYQKNSTIGILKNVTYLLPIYFLLLLALGVMRVPYHVGPLDSANRIISHIAPIMIFYLALIFCDSPNRLKSEKDDFLFKSYEL